MPPDFSAALLAGGRSTRMGRDKAFLPHHGLPLWRVQIEKLYALAPRDLFIAARAEQGFADLICEVPECVSLITDPPGENDGPLPAILRCLRAASGPLLVLAVDMPGMSEAFLRDSLMSGVKPARGRVPRAGDCYEPLAAIYDPAMLPVMEQVLAEGERSLQVVIRAAVSAGVCDVLDLTAEQAVLFENWNAPQDVARTP
jgi:molybdenum cofactor guanylyltransferase